MPAESPDTPIAGNSADQQVIEATRHWLQQAVIGLNLCPFASRVVERQQLRMQVSRAQDPLDLLVEVADELQLLKAASAADVATSLLIAPDALADFFDFNDFLGDAEALIEDLGLEGVFQIASFHPDYQFADTAAHDIGNYTNRSPYPTLHFLREDSLSEAIDGFGDTDLIIERNQETLRRLGLAGWQKLMRR